MDHIDTAQAARFLTALSSDNLHTFQTFEDSKRGVRGLSRILHGSLEQRVRTLEALNLEGAGVFVMVNRGDGYGRKASNVTGIRALFVDLDGASIEPVLAAPIRPRIVVESSPGKWHAYWPVVDIPTDHFSAAQKVLAARFGADPKVHDKPRVMRLPGFLHRKAAPFTTRLVECEGGPLTWGELAEAFGLQTRFRLPHVIREGGRNAELFKLAARAKRTGVPQSAQLAKALTVNAERCKPPLHDAEVRAVVVSAYRSELSGALSIPLELFDAPAFKALDDTARLVVVLAYRRADGFNAGCVTLPHSELVEWFPRKKTFLAARARAAASGLLTVAKPATKAMPRKGRGPKPTFYQLAIGPFSATYSTAQIGPFSATPEALQAVAPVAPDVVLGVVGALGADARDSRSYSPSGIGSVCHDGDPC
ncbi:DNA-primase RepB domain-containing protein [Lysobacter sp. A3-1-A15]|uniref:DNA-primase RepB domain-containing protein n=1 Tax=Novilysobacter viscosus TaxID=3098602 RepID=UPI002ED82E50